MQLLFLTTTDVQSDRRDELDRMIRSVAASLPAGSSVHHILLLQRATEEQRGALAASMPYPATVLALAHRVSLSAARNIMLDHARRSGLLSPDILVGFPDDDCWYPSTFLGRLVSEFERDAELGLLFTRVSLTPVEIWPRSSMRVATPTDVLRRSNSNSLFLRGAVVAAIGGFDETLGLGTPNGSGEDTDYGLRASFAAPRTVYVDQDLVGHHEGDLASKTKYFSGNLVVASRYATRHPKLFFEFARKIAVGAYLVLRRRLKMASYLNAIQGSVGAFGRSAG
ncbi:MAG: glycosyltransferase [Hyphomicrobiaceae bacterium]